MKVVLSGTSGITANLNFASVSELRGMMLITCHSDAERKESFMQGLILMQLCVKQLRQDVGLVIYLVILLTYCSSCTSAVLTVNVVCEAFLALLTTAK